MNGIEATRRIHAELPQIQVIGLSMFEDDEKARQMLEAGAAGYVSKAESTEGLLASVRSCYRRARGPDAPQLEMPFR